MDGGGYRVQAGESWDRTCEKPIVGLAAIAGVKVERMIGVYCRERSYRFDDYSL
jgi:hypothetical protein